MPQNAYGSYNITYTVTTNESEGTSSPVSDSKTLAVVVAPDPDAPTVSGSSSVVEDQSVNFGRNIAYSLVDTDGSEQIVEVQIADIPAGWTVSFTGGSMPANVVLIGGVYTVTGTEAEIRAAVDEFCITPPTNADGNRDPDVADAGITVRVTTQDSHDGIFSNGDRATTTAQHEFTVQADADTPLAAAADVDGVEDTTFKMWPGGTGVSVGLTDTDGSETLTAKITGVPSSWTITADTSGGGTFTRNGDGSLSLTGTEAQINAILAGIELRAPLNWSGVIPGVQLLVTATEAATGTEVADKTAQASVTFDITVAAVADVPPSTSCRRLPAMPATKTRRSRSASPRSSSTATARRRCCTRCAGCRPVLCSATPLALRSARGRHRRQRHARCLALHGLRDCPVARSAGAALQPRFHPRGAGSLDREQRGAHPAGLRRRRLFELGAAAGRGDWRRRQGDTDHHPDRRGRGRALPARPGHLRIAGRHRHPQEAANSSHSIS